MDANGLRFWLIANAEHWPARERTVYDTDCRLLRLTSERVLPEPADPVANSSIAVSALERIPRALDANGSVGRWNRDAMAIVVRGLLPGEAVSLPLEQEPSDFAVGFDGIVYVLLSDRVRLHDLRGRWPDETVPLNGFVSWRLAVDGGGGIWIIERATGRLGRLTSSPLPFRPSEDYAPDVFRPKPENCHPPEFRVWDGLGWLDNEHVLALDWHPQAGLGLLSSLANGKTLLLRNFDARLGQLGPAFTLDGARNAYAFAWLEESKLVVRMPGRRDAPAFDLATADKSGLVRPSGEIYPLADGKIEAPFAHHLEGPPHYPVEIAEGVTGAEPLFRLSISNLARHGEARNYAGTTPQVDSGTQQTLWHRVYAEAAIPPHAGFILWLAATESAEAPPDQDQEAWLPHCFGDVPRPFPPQVPQAVWEHGPSELPNHPGLGPWSPRPGRAGLFSVLVQNHRQRVRALRGRYLWVRVELLGDSRVGPEIAALRIYASRFSYRDNYLPRLYRESVYGDLARLPGERVADLNLDLEAELNLGGVPAATLLDPLAQAGVRLGSTAIIEIGQAGKSWLLRDASQVWHLRLEQSAIAVYRPQATPSDFLERLLCNFEGMLTPLEDRIASAHLWSEPDSVPEAHLDWLAAWVGVAFDPALPEARRRDWLRAAPKLARCHGTQRGLELALDLASGGGVRGGEIIVLEDFRLRRLLATLLGVELNDDNDPLLPGLVVSGNSVVGDTLVLGEAESAELMALFREDMATAMENNAVLAFYDQLAYRATVLVHQEVQPQELGLLRRVVELEAPAHVEVRVVNATWPFLVGIASLVGVDTYLGPSRPQNPVRADVSGLGLGDFMLGSNSLDPRVDGSVAVLPAEPPVADAGNDRLVSSSGSFNLDGSRSRPGRGHTLRDYVWRLLPEI